MSHTHTRSTERRVPWLPVAELGQAGGGGTEGTPVQMSPKGCLYLLVAIVVLGVLIGLQNQGATP